MTSVTTMVHVRPDDRAFAQVVPDEDTAPHVVLTWHPDRACHVFFRDVATLDKAIAELQMARDGLALLLDEPVPYEPTLAVVPEVRG